MPSEASQATLSTSLKIIGMSSSLTRETILSLNHLGRSLDNGMYLSSTMKTVAESLGPRIALPAAWIADRVARWPPHQALLTHVYNGILPRSRLEFGSEGE